MNTETKTPEQIKADLRTAAVALQQALSDAQEAGLKVECDLERHQDMIGHVYYRIITNCWAPIHTADDDA